MFSAEKALSLCAFAQLCSKLMLRLLCTRTHSGAVSITLRAVVTPSLPAPSNNSLCQMTVK